MSARVLPVPAAADWRPMPFRATDVRRVPDPLFEPMWAGRRALIQVGGGVVELSDDRGAPVAGFSALRVALATTVRAEEAVLDGYLFPGLLPDTTGRESPVGMGAVMTAGEVNRQLFLGSGRSRDQRHQEQEAAAARRVVLDPDAVTSFVATDLVWLDGESLLDVPLAERKRLLESVVDEGELVRRSMSVRSPVEQWFPQWRAMGFREYAAKPANSRYVPGPEGQGWTTALIPRR